MLGSLILTLFYYHLGSLGMGRKVCKCSPKWYITLCYSLVGESWHGTYQVDAQLHNFGSAALLSWSQGHHQCWQSLPSPLGVFPSSPWLRIPFQPCRSIRPCRSGASIMPVFTSCSLAWPQVPLTEAQPWADVPVHPHSQGDDSWSGFLAEPDLQTLGLSLSFAGGLWSWALAISLG